MSILKTKRTNQVVVRQGVLKDTLNHSPKTRLSVTRAKDGRMRTALLIQEDAATFMTSGMIKFQLLSYLFFALGVYLFCLGGTRKTNNQYFLLKPKIKLKTLTVSKSFSGIL